MSDNQKRTAAQLKNDEKDRFILRFHTSDARNTLKSQAARNGRSLNSEILRLIDLGLNSDSTEKFSDKMLCEFLTEVQKKLQREDSKNFVESLKENMHAGNGTYLVARPPFQVALMADDGKVMIDTIDIREDILEIFEGGFKSSRILETAKAFRDFSDELTELAKARS